MKETIQLSWEAVLGRLAEIEGQERGGLVYGVPNGGMILTAFCKKLKPTHNVGEADVILDDIEDSGKTRQWYEYNYPNADFVSLIDPINTPKWRDKWITFPWEAEHPSGTKTIEQNITRVLQLIGEDPTRDGLIDTPSRVIRSYKELYNGYGKNPKDVFTIFENQEYKSMVLLKDIELYSVCEHHMLPFYGKAHVAYIPDGGKIIGISKLARLVDIFARRLQVQERIGEQVTESLMEFLKPKGAACVIEASHMCIQMRGIGKQHSVMVTSSLKGEFMQFPEVRQELMDLIFKK